MAGSMCETAGAFVQKTISNNFVVFSISPDWVDAIRSGFKTVELRRRPPKLVKPIHAAIYTTLPRGQIEIICRMGPVLTASPEELWDKCGHKSAVTRDHFDSYFERSAMAHAIEISDVQALKKPLSLAYLREQSKFSPPQSWQWGSVELFRLIGSFE